MFADGVVVGEVAMGGVEFEIFEAQALVGAGEERFFFWLHGCRVF